MSIMEGRGKGELFFTDNVLKMPNINPARHGFAYRA